MSIKILGTKNFYTSLYFHSLFSHEWFHVKTIKILSSSSLEDIFYKHWKDEQKKQDIVNENG